MAKKSRTIVASDAVHAIHAELLLHLFGSIRALLVTILCFLIVLLSIDKFNLAELLPLAAFPLFLITAGQLSFPKIVKKVALLSPFVLVMALSNVLLDQTPIAPITHIAHVTITGGMISGSVIVLKTIIAITTIIALTNSVAFYRICQALSSLHLPHVLVTQLLLLYRYSAVVQEEALAMQKARDLRSFNGKGRELRRTASLLGALLLRTTHRAERLYRAMYARGFTEQMISNHNDSAFTAREVMVITIFTLLFVLLRFLF